MTKTASATFVALPICAAVPCGAPRRSGAVAASAAFHFPGHRIQVVGPVAGVPMESCMRERSWLIKNGLWINE
jgi:hypothetical protein